MILNALTDPAVVIDRQGAIHRVNNAWSDFARCNGASQDICDGVASNYFDACRSSQDGQAVMAGLWAVFSGSQSSFEFEYPCHAPGCQRWFLLQAAPIDRSRSRLLLVHVDITNRREAECRLCEQRDFLQQILNTVETIILTLDCQGRVTMINRFGANMLERPETEILGRNWFSTFLKQPEGMERVYPVFQSVINGQLAGAEYFESDIQTARGKCHTIAWHSTYLRDGSGTITGTISAGNDISDKQRITQELLIRNTELQRAQSVSKIGSWQVDAIKNHATWSLETYRIFGVEPSSEVSVELFLSRVHAEDRPHIQALISNAIQQKAKSYSAEHRIEVGGKIKWIQEQAEQDFGLDGEFLGAHGTAWDITERKLADLDLREALARNELIREEERLRIARELHDDLGQRMTAIKLHLSRLVGLANTHDTNLSQELQMLATQTESTMISIREIVKELRPSILDCQDLGGAIDHEVELLRKRLGIRCLFRRPDKLIELTDKPKTHIFRIFQESLTNVARHAEATRVEVSLDRSQTELLLVVMDNGQGIPHGALSGNTLGLVGMQERAHEVNASLEIETRPEFEGTRLSLRVPLPQSHQPTVAR